MIFPWKVHGYPFCVMFCLLWPLLYPSFFIRFCAFLAWTSSRSYIWEGVKFWWSWIARSMQDSGETGSAAGAEHGKPICHTQKLCRWKAVNYKLTVGMSIFSVALAKSGNIALGIVCPSICGHSHKGPFPVQWCCLCVCYQETFLWSFSLMQLNHPRNVHFPGVLRFFNNLCRYFDFLTRQSQCSVQEVSNLQSIQCGIATLSKTPLGTEYFLAWLFWCCSSEHTHESHHNYSCFPCTTAPRLLHTSKCSHFKHDSLWN